ncbi:MAG: hypothetical protein WAV18_30040, partial [Roseiarcus sp.]
FLAAMKKKRIACLTYHKHPGEDWPRQEFFATPVARSRTGKDERETWRKMSLIIGEVTTLACLPGMVVFS